MVPKDVEKLVVENRHLAYFVAHEYFKRGVEPEDVISIASYGLVKAAYSFDSNKGYTFSTIAVPIMRNEIKQELRKTFAQKNHIQRVARSLNAPIDSSKTDGDTWEEILPDRDSCFEEAVEEQILVEGVLTDLLNVCSSKQCLVFLLSILGIEQHKMAETFGVTTPAVSRAFTKAQKRLKKCMEARAKSVGSLSFLAKDDEYQLVIKGNAQHFRWSLLRMIQKAKNLKCELTVSEKEIVIRMPRDERAFKFLVMLINELEEYDYDVETLLNEA